MPNLNRRSITEITFPRTLMTPLACFDICGTRCDLLNRQDLAKVLHLHRKLLLGESEGQVFSGPMVGFGLHSHSLP